MQKVTPGKYKHFKGGVYEVLFLAKDSETLQDLVVYKSLYGSPEFKKGAIWTRPLEMFLESIEHNGKVINRFERI